jgi:hypothetical protein
MGNRLNKETELLIKPFFASYPPDVSNIVIRDQ